MNPLPDSLQPLPIVYQADDLVAINKPHGLLVHRSPIASDATEFAVQLLRDQLGQRVYPVHRLDRKTGGVLLFALSEAMNSVMQQQFMDGHVHKTYIAIVRGYAPDTQTIDYPLRNDETGVVQDAVTHIKTATAYRNSVAVWKTCHIPLFTSGVDAYNRPDAPVAETHGSYSPPHHRRPAPRLQQTE